MTGPTPQPRKPVILTVDDDPAVSRAVARDLRRHYGERYRIVRAESGPDALETLNELKLRGDTVAVFVADYRMPQMSGIEVLGGASVLGAQSAFIPLVHGRRAEGQAAAGRGRSRRLPGSGGDHRAG